MVVKLERYCRTTPQYVRQYVTHFVPKNLCYAYIEIGVILLANDSVHDWEILYCKCCFNTHCNNVIILIKWQTE